MISGTTRILVILGDPIDKVRSPETFTRRFEASGIDAIMIPVHVAPAELRTVVEGLKCWRNLAGIVVTMPHKEAMLGFADEVFEAGRLVGAVNALRPTGDGRWQADMFDGIGFVGGLTAQGQSARGRRVALLGAGGAGAAIAASLAQAGAAAIAVHDLDAKKAERLVAALHRAHPQLEARVAPPDLARDDLLVNATPLGMKADDPLPWDLAGLRPGTVIGDVTTKPDTPPFIAEAERRGAAVVRGRDMHEGQVRALAAFFGFTLAT
jgi:shikimate dehydrogenase